MNPELNKIYCGDALEVLRGWPGEFVDCVITSPPYNKHSAKRKHSLTDAWTKSGIDYGEFKDDLPEKEYQEQQRQIIRQLVRVIKPSGSIFYNHKYRIVNHRIISPEEWLGEFIVRQVIIWDRGSSPVLDTIRFMPTIEQIYWITKERKTPYFTNAGFQFKDVWRINPESGNDHPAPFPEEIPGRCIIATCPESGIVLDPFIGSGTTAVVAKKLGRNYLGIELSPVYCKMAENRIAGIPEPMI
jgi:modification methylase